MAGLEAARRFVGGLPDVTEGESRGHRTWSVAGKTFAWERSFSKADLRRYGDEPVPQGPILALRTDGLDDKAALLQTHPEFLFTIPHLDGHAIVLLHLESADDDAVREALLDAWLVHAPADLARRFLGQE